VKLSQLPTLDLLEGIHQALGFRLSLKALATATLGISKPADGVQAVKWFRQGKIDQVLAYCQEDVRLTKELYEFGRRHGYLKYWDAARGESRAPVKW
jgi:DEAD/DEAH box helicase domain-containing protein